MIGAHWAAFRWGSDEESKRAFETIIKAPMGLSVWRFKMPMTPPHTDFVIVVMGEGEAGLRVCERVLVGLGGEPFDLDPALVASLRKRRARQAVEDRGRGGFYLTRGQRRLFPDGHTEPYED